MKLKFKNQDFQTDAVNAVADLFKGHERLQSTFEIAQDAQYSLFQNELSIGNGIRISDEQLNANMHDTQRRRQLIYKTVCAHSVSRWKRELVRLMFTQKPSLRLTSLTALQSS